MQKIKELRTLKGHRNVVNSVAFSPDGKLLASVGSYDNTVKLWSIPEKCFFTSLSEKWAIFFVCCFLLAVHRLFCVPTAVPIFSARVSLSIATMRPVLLSICCATVCSYFLFCLSTFVCQHGILLFLHTLFLALGERCVYRSIVFLEGNFYQL